MTPILVILKYILVVSLQYKNVIIVFCHVLNYFFKKNYNNNTVIIALPAGNTALEEQAIKCLKPTSQLLTCSINLSAWVSKVLLNMLRTSFTFVCLAMTLVTVAALPPGWERDGLLDYAIIQEDSFPGRPASRLKVVCGTFLQTLVVVQHNGIHICRMNALTTTPHTGPDLIATPLAPTLPSPGAWTCPRTRRTRMSPSWSSW